MATSYSKYQLKTSWKKLKKCFPQYWNWNKKNLFILRYEPAPTQSNLLELFFSISEPVHIAGVNRFSVNRFNYSAFISTGVNRLGVTLR